MQRLVPADHFLLTCTLPAEWRGLAAAHADVAFDCLMRCAWETVLRFSQNDRQLQGTPGAIAVLRTHACRLDFHRHVHLVVPAAAIDVATQRWRCKRRGRKGTDLFNEKAMAKVFRAKTLAAIEAAGVGLPASCPRQWVAHGQSVGSGRQGPDPPRSLSLPRRPSGTGHPRLREWPGELPLSQRGNRQVGKAHAQRCRLPLADSPACACCPRAFAARAISASCTPTASA
nr:transposase [Accumulibacter sp.]